MFDWLDFSLLSIGSYQLTLGRLLFSIITVIAAFSVSKWAQQGFLRLARYRNRQSDPQIYVLTRIIHYLTLFLGFAIALAMLGVTYDNVVIIAGALGVGVGFGLQNIVSNFVSGIIILFEKSLKVGDFIELESGVTGEVIEINIRYTLVRTNDNIETLIPNSEFVSARVTNWTMSDEICRFRIPFGVAYGTDKEVVQRAVLQAAARISYTLDSETHKSEVLMTGFGDSSLDFVLAVWVAAGVTRRPGRIRSDYLWAIDDALREAGIEIPFPQRDLHLRSSALTVNTDADLRQDSP